MNELMSFLSLSPPPQHTHTHAHSDTVTRTIVNFFFTSFAEHMCDRLKLTYQLHHTCQIKKTAGIKFTNLSKSVHFKNLLFHPWGTAEHFHS